MIYFVRHGETDFNKYQVSQGQLETSLNRKGIEQAIETAEKLKDYKFDVVISSPLTRTVQTAEYIMKYHSNELILDDRIKEVSKGSLQGSKHPQSVYDDYFKDPHKYGGETDEEVYNRVYSFLNDLEKYKGKSILIIGHGEILKYLKSALKNQKEILLKRTENYQVVKNGQIEEIEF